MNSFIEIISLLASTASVYSTSVVDNATYFCNLDCHETTPPALSHDISVRNSTKTEKELVLKEGLVLLLGTVLRQRRISTMRGVELWGKGRVSEMEREREREREGENDATKDICIMRRKYTLVARRLKTGVEPIWFELMPCASYSGPSWSSIGGGGCVIRPGIVLS